MCYNNINTYIVCCLILNSQQHENNQLQPNITIPTGINSNLKPSFSYFQQISQLGFHSMHSTDSMSGFVFVCMQFSCEIFNCGKFQLCLQIGDKRYGCVSVWREINFVWPWPVNILQSVNVLFRWEWSQICVMVGRLAEIGYFEISNIWTNHSQ